MRNTGSAPIVAGIAAGLLVFALAGYFLLISPQNARSAKLEHQVEVTQAQIDQYRAQAAQASTATPIRVAELFRLTKAMPDEVDMSGLLLELSRVARESGIELDSVTPQAPAVASGYQSMPITLEVDGNYYELSDFLFRLRNLVRVRSGLLDAQGRLFVVDSIGFSESTKSFPRIKASLTLHAFVYGDNTVPVAAPAVAPTTTTTTTTAPTTTTPTTTTPPQSLDTPPDTSASGGAVP
jgi:type IV pilus assembly protein PilO